MATLNEEMTVGGQIEKARRKAYGLFKQIAENALLMCKYLEDGRTPEGQSKALSHTAADAAALIAMAYQMEELKEWMDATEAAKTKS